MQAQYGHEPPKKLTLDDRDGRAPLPGKMSRCLTGLAGADDHQVVGLIHCHHSRAVGMSLPLLQYGLPYLSSVDSIRHVTKPLLPAIDAASRLREAAFAGLIRDRKPLEVDELSHTTGMESEAVGRATATLAAGGWLDLDDAGRITGAAGLSLSTGPHRLTLEGTPFRTWCAYDGLGIAAALEADALVETDCGHCGQAIRIAFTDGVPERTGPERLWLADGGDDLRGSFCTPTVLLCGEAHGAAWAEAQAGRGRLLDLAEGARQGGAEWAGCAAASRRLA